MTTLDWTVKRFPPLAFAAAAAARRMPGDAPEPIDNLIRPPAAAREFAVALACVAVVTAIRLLLNATLASVSPLLIFVLPTAVMAMRQAPLPALFAALVSAAVSVRLFIQPADPAWWAHSPQQVRLAVFAVENVAIVALGWLLQRERRRGLERALQAERLRVVHVTMRTVQHVVNNSLNQLQGLRFDAEGHVPSEVVASFDATIHDTFAKLAVLGNIPAYAEKPMESGIGLDDGAGAP
jgi:K+-sensing histidine kinase KdpD